MHRHAEPATDRLPFVRVVAGLPDEDELAALVVALTALVARPPAAAATFTRPAWWLTGSTRRMSGWQARSTGRPGVPGIR